MITINKEELKQHIIEWAEIHIGSSFEFREYQFDAVFDICLNILEGITLNRYMLYFDRCYKRYVNKYYKENKKIFIVPENNLEIPINENKEFQVKLLLNNFDIVIDELLAESCKYSKYSPVYNNLKLSLLLSLLRKEEVYFHLNKSQRSYVKVLYNKLLKVLDSEN